MKFDHLSSSQINNWIDDPALWILKYLYGIKGGRMPAAWRGNAVEKAVDLMLTKGEFREHFLLDTARMEFLRLGGLQTDKEWNIIPDYIAQVLPFIKDCGWGIPEGCQTSLEVEIEGVKFIGYMDYDWPGMVRDCKTTGRLPSFSKEGVLKGKDDHLRQMSIYTHNSNRGAELFYVTPKTVKIYQPSADELNKAFRHVTAAIRAMKEFEPQDWFRYVPRDMSHWKWDDKLREKAKELWKL